MSPDLKYFLHNILFNDIHAVFHASLNKHSSTRFSARTQGESQGRGQSATYVRHQNRKGFGLQQPA